MIPHGPSVFTVHHPERKVTSMCLEINDWTHTDCPGGWCTCDCNHPHITSQEMT